MKILVNSSRSVCGLGQVCFKLLLVAVDQKGNIFLERAGRCLLLLSELKKWEGTIIRIADWELKV